MAFDLAAIPDVRDRQDGVIDAGTIAADIGLAAVLAALAPLLGAMDGELREILERAQGYFAAKPYALAS